MPKKKEETQQEPKVVSEPKSEPSKQNYNVAVVYNGNKEVRRYEKEKHGNEFENLANIYVTSRSNPQLRVELVFEEPKVQCPSCLHRFKV